VSCRRHRNQRYGPRSSPRSSANCLARTMTP
jgi:hypothetical protein